MKTILCTGDSHTWGQGGSGWEVMGAVESGEKRLVDFGCNGYVNQLRRFLADRGLSADEEVTAETLHRVHGLPMSESGALLARALELETAAELVRIQFLGTAGGYTALIRLNGEEVQRLYMPPAETGYIRNAALFTKSSGKRQRLVIEPTEGDACVYRIELYGGAWAVINAGIGSCTSARYLEAYWQEYVAAYRPSVIVMEAHSINDWLSNQPPAVCGESVGRLIDAGLRLGGRGLLLTVSPILGGQRNAAGVAYEDYVQESRRVAGTYGVPLCDANTRMKKELRGLSADEARAGLFADDWHVNDRGHRLYAEELWKKLNNMRKGSQA